MSDEGTPANPFPPTGATEYVEPEKIDPSQAVPARTYSVLAGDQAGAKDSYGADREAAEAVVALAPAVGEAARVALAFMPWAVGCLAGRGHTQFLDLGCGMPPGSPEDAVAEIARKACSAARVVYVDDDPVVCTHRRAIDHDSVIIRADIRDVPTILADRRVARALNLALPVVVLLGAVLHFVSDEDAATILRDLNDGLAPGSALILTHGEDRADVRAAAAAYSEAVTMVFLRDADQIRGLVQRAGWGLELPGVQPAVRWPIGTIRNLDDPPPLLAAICYRPAYQSAGCVL